jgi:cyclase
MRRGLVLGTLVGVGALSLVVSGQAPGPSAAAIKAMQIEKVKDNLYIISGSGAENQAAFSGGNVAVFIADAGVTLVDTKLPGFGPTILERIKTVTNKPVTRIINTHTHGDHTGGNSSFGASVESIVHENTRTNMAKMPEFSGANAQFIPKRTYKDKLTVGSGKDQIDLYYFGRGHTNGDTFVVFPALRTMHVGDMFAWKALPYVDTDNGGSVVEQPETLAKVVAGVKNVDTIINGHIPVGTWNDLRDYADFTKDFVDFARASMKAGKTVEQAAGEYKVAPRFKGYAVSVNPAFGDALGNLKIAYQELQKK